MEEAKGENMNMSAISKSVTQRHEELPKDADIHVIMLDGTSFVCRVYGRIFTPMKTTTPAPWWAFRHKKTTIQKPPYPEDGKWVFLREWYQHHGDFIDVGEIKVNTNGIAYFYIKEVACAS